MLSVALVISIFGIVGFCGQALVDHRQGKRQDDTTLFGLGVSLGGGLACWILYAFHWHDGLVRIAVLSVCSFVGFIVVALTYDWASPPQPEDQ